MTFDVIFTALVETDLIECYDWIESSDGPDRAFKIMNDVVTAMEGLAEHPQRGSRLVFEAVPFVREYRLILKHGFKVIYWIDEQKVVIAAVVHERRDLRATLEARNVALAKSKQRRRS